MTTSLRPSHVRTVLVILLAITFVSRAALLFRSDANLASRLFDDDSYYLHSVSYHLAHGGGLSVDGTHATNGIQPLIVVLQAPCYLLAGVDKWLGLRLTFLLSALFDTLSALLIYKLLSQLSKQQNIAPLVGAALWTFVYPVIAQTVNGLETGLYSVLILASLNLFALRRSAIRAGQVPLLQDDLFFGIVLGLLVLARIDAVFFVVCYLIMEYVNGRRTVRVLVPAVTAFVVSSPWWIYNYLVFGSLMPTSGQAESVGGASIVPNLAHLATTLSDILSTFYTVPFYTTPTAMLIAGCVIIPLTVWWVARTLSLAQRIRTAFNVAPLLPLIYVGAAFALYYVVFFHAPYFLPRYLQPLRIAWILLVAMAAPSIVASLPRFSVLARITLIVWLMSGISFSVVRYAHNFTATGSGDLYQMGLWARQHPDATIGMQQSGIASFVSDNVVNLDGKVNAQALGALQRGERGKYIVSSGINYIADWTDFAKVLVEEAETFGGEFRLADSAGLVRIYKRVR